MKKRTALVMTFTLLALAVVTTIAQRPNPAFPHQDAPAPAVLALSIQGQPTLVSPSAPVPVVIPTPVPVTFPTPVVVTDANRAITATGDYTFVFASAVTLPKMSQPVGSIDVRVLQINGKWVTAEYKGTQGTARMVFNTQVLLGFSTTH